MGAQAKTQNGLQNIENVQRFPCVSTELCVPCEPKVVLPISIQRKIFIFSFLKLELLSAQPSWFTLWEAFDITDTCAAHAGLVHDVMDTDYQMRMAVLMDVF